MLRSKHPALVARGLWAICGIVFIPAPVSAMQNRSPINVYRFVIGMDVPESPAFVAAEIGQSAILLGSAPKPLAVNILISNPVRGETSPAASLDFAPYYLLGGGQRRLESYRSLSLAGRLMRVLTKTIFSIGMVPRGGSTTTLAIGARSTLHDPHDPITATSLPERTSQALSRAGISPPDRSAETITDLGVDLDTIYADARRRVRARSGDAQVSAGWGASTRAKGGVFDRDSLGPMRHAFWLSAQYTVGARYDVLATFQLRNAFRVDDRLWIGAALQRKTGTADLQAGLFYDTVSKSLHPTIQLDTRLASQLGVRTTLRTSAAEPAYTGPRTLRFSILLRWFKASDCLCR